MNQFHTEAEAWTAIADTLEMLEDMPPCGFNDADGLCDVLKMMRKDRVIGDSLFWDMRERTVLALRPATTWLARPGLYKPRIRFARQFAKDSHD